MAANTYSADQPVEVFWAPGSTASLRLREFVAEAGVTHELVNVAENPDRLLELRSHGINSAAAARRGTRYVNGSNLDQVADLVGIDYQRPVMLSPTALANTYQLVTSALRRLLGQLTPELSSAKSPDQSRTVLGLAYHASSVMRMFLRAFDPESWDSDDYHAVMMESRGQSDNFADIEATLRRLDDTVSRFSTWWNTHGESTDMGRVTSVYWGDHTLHALLEREVWHTAQHTRQLESLVVESGIALDQPLSDADLAGLPLPKALYA